MKFIVSGTTKIIEKINKRTSERKNEEKKGFDIDESICQIQIEFHCSLMAARGPQLRDSPKAENRAFGSRIQPSDVLTYLLLDVGHEVFSACFVDFGVAN